MVVLIFGFFITGPSLPYGLSSSANAMAESPDGKGVLLFGGHSNENSLVRLEKRILEFRAGANSWNILNVSLEHASCMHVVIPLK